ncbi:PREDICTED: transmembrane protein 222 [Pygoscelis adeliae]|nr:PREDICTED: transmembrane protein 222 [Pygoscelis adeliae]
MPPAHAGGEGVRWHCGESRPAEAGGGGGFAKGADPEEHDLGLSIRSDAVTGHAETVPTLQLDVSRSAWLFPIIGHMGICTSTGVIRDFAGPYFVSEDNMAFGKPVKYWKLDPSKVYSTGPNAWDTAVHDASEEYKHRMHNLCCDNCHSHVALALNLMRYDNSTSWNMVKLCFFSLLYGKYVSIGGFVKTWLPFVLFLGVIVTVVLTLHLR